jgi:hypothetical protein
MKKTKILSIAVAAATLFSASNVFAGMWSADQAGETAEQDAEAFGQDAENVAKQAVDIVKTPVTVGKDLANGNDTGAGQAILGSGGGVVGIAAAATSNGSPTFSQQESSTDKALNTAVTAGEDAADA